MKIGLMLLLAVFAFQPTQPININIGGSCCFVISPPLFGAGWREDCPKVYREEITCPVGYEAGGFPLTYQECTEIVQIVVPGYEDDPDPYYSVECTAYRTMTRSPAPCYQETFPVPIDKLPPECPTIQKVRVPCGAGLEDPGCM